MRRIFRPWRHTLTHSPTRWLFLLAFFAPVALLFGLVIVLPAALTASFPARYTDEGGEIAEEACTALRPLPASIDSLQAVETFLNTRLALAQQEAISLAVNLVDSTLVIEISGVPIRKVPILHYRISAALRHARRGGCLARWMGQPFTLQRDVATLAKAPVRVVSAPRDTIEAQARPPDAMPVETNETHVILQFDRGLTLRIGQPSRSVENILFDVQEHVRTAARAVARLAHGQAPEHEGRVTLTLAPEDAKAVYRALPDDAKLALRL